MSPGSCCALWEVDSPRDPPEPRTRHCTDLRWSLRYHPDGKLLTPPAHSSHRFSVGSKEVLLNHGGQSTCWEYTQLRQWAPISNTYYAHFRVPHFTNKTHFQQSECRQNFCCCREIDRGRMCRRQDCGSFWHNTTDIILLNEYSRQRVCWPTPLEVKV